MQRLKKLPIKGFIETSFVDWPGKISSVIFLSRCNFRCRYCHNAEIVLRHETIKNISFAVILQYLAAQKKWVDGVCISGGEPTLHEDLPFVLEVLKHEGFLTKLDTNGSNPDILQSIIAGGLVDYIAMDIKASLNESSYCRITQADNMLTLVKRSIRILIDSGIQHEFRCTVLPSYHGPEEIINIARELNGAQRLKIQNFNPTHTLDPELKSHQPYSEEMIDHIQQQVNAII
ncbi:MAG: anaerobic ribonucleoside-triphosphate reductase activating protein [Pseudomonadota bacterium]